VSLAAFCRCRSRSDRSFDHARTWRSKAFQSRAFSVCGQLCIVPTFDAFVRFAGLLTSKAIRSDALISLELAVWFLSEPAVQQLDGIRHIRSCFASFVAKSATRLRVVLVVRHSFARRHK